MPRNSLLDDILTALGDRVVQRKPDGEIIAWCPFHADGQGSSPHRPNLVIRPGNRGASYVWFCQVCNEGGTLLQLANRLREIGAMPSRDGQKPGDSIVGTYNYGDEQGNVLYQVVRSTGKRFRHRRPDGKGGWVEEQGCMDGVRRVPYRLPELLAADSAEWVYVPEGEKDCDTLVHLGLVATTNSGGAGKWRDELSSHLKDRKVAILPDNDGQGQAHAQDVAAKMAPHAAEIRIVNLPDLADKGDVSDWLGQGGTVDDLRVLVESAPTWNENIPDENTASEPPERFPCTDAGNGELFAHLCGDRLCYDHRRHRWLLWQAHWWQPDLDAQVRRLVKNAARRRYQAAASIDNLKHREAEARWAIGSESRMRLDATLSLAQAERPIADSGENWDGDPWLLAVTNGVIELRTGELRDGRPEDRITMHSPVAYDPDAPYPRWLQFLHEVFNDDDELIDYIQRYCGYSITGCTAEQCHAILWGEGWNGKGTFSRVQREVLGDYAANTPFSTLEMSNRYSIPNDLAALYGKRLVTASELNESVRLNEARMKMLAGEDPVTARFLHGEFFTFNPAAKFWLSVNHKPIVRDDSTGFWRKIRLIPFTQCFRDCADLNLKDILRTEYAGILAWMVEGCLAWRQKGLGPPESVRVATEAYRQESDPVAAFLNECCEIGAEHTVRAGHFYKAYERWALEQGLKEREQLTATKFGLILGQRFQKQHARDGMFYQGIGLRDNPTGGHNDP